jgi:hypothetical protein
MQGQILSSNYAKTNKLLFSTLYALTIIGGVITIPIFALHAPLPITLILSAGFILSLIAIKRSKKPWAVAEKVCKTDEGLTIEQNGETIYLPLNEIESIKESVFKKYTTITLKLKRPSPLGQTIVFFPQKSIDIEAALDSIAYEVEIATIKPNLGNRENS